MRCPKCHQITKTEVLVCDHCRHDLSIDVATVWEKYKNVPAQCPECGRMTDSLKVYNLPAFWLFLGIYLRYSYKGHIACPSCMRKKILLHGFTYNIISANLIWIFTILPWSLINLLRTFSKGHSWEVVDFMDNIYS